MFISFMKIGAQPSTSNTHSHLARVIMTRRKSVTTRHTRIAAAGSQPHAGVSVPTDWSSAWP